MLENSFDNCLYVLCFLFEYFRVNRQFSINFQIFHDSKLKSCDLLPWEKSTSIKIRPFFVARQWFGQTLFVSTWIVFTPVSMLKLTLNSFNEKQKTTTLTINLFTRFNLYFGKVIYFSPYFLWDTIICLRNTHTLTALMTILFVEFGKFNRHLRNCPDKCLQWLIKFQLCKCNL